MPAPRRILRGLSDLGRAIDERILARGAQLDLRHDTGAPLAVPLAASGRPAAGGGGGGSSDSVSVEWIRCSLTVGAGASATLTLGAASLFGCAQGWYYCRRDSDVETGQWAVWHVGSAADLSRRAAGSDCGLSLAADLSSDRLCLTLSATPGSAALLLRLTYCLEPAL